MTKVRRGLLRLIMDAEATIRPEKLRTTLVRIDKFRSEEVPLGIPCERIPKSISSLMYCTLLSQTRPISKGNTMACTCDECNGDCYTKSKATLCTHGTGSFFVSMPGGKRACSNKTLPGLDKCVDHASADELRAVVRRLLNLEG